MLLPARPRPVRLPSPLIEAWLTSTLPAMQQLKESAILPATLCFVRGRAGTACMASTSSPAGGRLPATDQQGDISQARGMLGQLLFEFGQLELNKDLLEAIKRTESRTGELAGLRLQQLASLL